MPSHVKRKVWAVDCETDPFLFDRVPEPFIWGAWSEDEYLVFDGPWATQKFAAWAAEQHAFLYAHNGGKFDFIFLLPYIKQTKAKIIKSRVVEIEIGNSKLRDSYSIIPIALKDYQKDDIEYWKLEANVRKQHMPEILRYLESDCRNLFELITAYRNSAGKGLTIAGNAFAFAKKQCDLHIPRNNKKFDDRFRPFYYGGRCEVFNPGTHNDVQIFDIKSAYPWAMVHDHPNGCDFTVRNHASLSEERLNTCFLELTCHSKGAFPVKDYGGLSFPHIHGKFFVTGWEYNTALKHGLISDVEVETCYEFYDSINFKPYVDHWFNHKDQADKEGDKANRIIGKIMLNSLYGKTAQNPVSYRDYIIMPLGSTPEEGWDLEAELENSEIHSRPTLWELQKKYGEKWETFPVYYNVAIASSITGFVRAMILDSVHTIGERHIIYCDTDCLFIGKTGDHEKLNKGPGLGQWDWEGMARPCHVAGRKLYAAKIIAGPKKGEKIASKGARLTLDEIKRVTEGEKVTWKNPAPSFKLDGSAEFVVRSIRSTHRKT